MPLPAAAARPFDLAVIGAGIVGVSTAHAARQRGLSVVLVDRREPGEETSYGNAGILSSGSVTPLNSPALWKSLPAYLGNRHPALRFAPGWWLRNNPWALRFLANANAAATAPRAAALNGLIQASLAQHRQWIVAAGETHRLRETGWLKLWRSDSLAAARAESEALAAFGIASDILDRQAISGLEPSLAPIYPVGLHHKDTASVDSPQAIVKAYARLLAQGGGTFVRGEVSALHQGAEGWRVVHANGEISARNVAVALGPWSPDLLAPLGYRVPMAYERGYHQEFRADAARRLGRPIYDAEGGFVLTPVENGLRLTTGVELAARDAPSSSLQLVAATAKARAILAFGDPVAAPWRGARPTFPDSLPMIGPAPRHKGLWLACGHQHIGLTTGPATGAAIAAMVAGDAPPFDARAFDPSRYLR